MPPLLADENFKFEIVRGLLRRNPGLDILRVQQVGLIRTPDPIVLAWAARENRIVLTHDVSTFPTPAYARVAAGEPMPGVIVVPWDMPVGRAVDDILLYIEASHPDEIINRVAYLPL